MKPTAQQTQLLKKYLRDTLSYRETYEEIYDHILTAVDNADTEISFEELVNNIIKNDFGGAKGLVKIEKQYHSAAVDEVIKQQWLNFIDNFKFPQIFLSLLLLGLTYYGLLHFNGQPFGIAVLSICLFTAPGIFVLIRYFKIGYATKDTKRSVKDKIIGQVASKPLLVLNPGLFFLIGKNNVSIWLHTHPFLTSMLLFIIALYIMAFIKLCRQDIKSYSVA